MRALFRLRAGRLLLTGVALALASSPAWPGERAEPRVVRSVVRVRPVPAVPPPVLIRDYLPRNPNVPMYNEPPRREPVW
jgi:hypothetical protein